VIKIKPDFIKYVESRLPRDDDKELFKQLWETYNEQGPDEVKKTIYELIKKLAEA